MAYQLYRNTTLGVTLQDSIDELIDNNQISASLAEKVRVMFDHTINAALENRVKTRWTFKARKLDTYRFCDNVWTFTLNDVEIREVDEFVIVGKLKFVACGEGRGKGKGKAEEIPPP